MQARIAVQRRGHARQSVSLKGHEFNDGTQKNLHGSLVSQTLGRLHE